MNIKDQAYQNLCDLKMICDKAGIFFWIEHGLLLGLHREGEIMESDAYDVDVCIWQEDVQKFEQIMPQFNSKPLLNKKGRFKERCLKYLPNGTLSSVAYRRRRNQLDIKVMFRSGMNVCHLMKKQDYSYCVYALDNKFYKKLGIIKWRDLELNCPQPIPDYLVARYGDWKSSVTRKEWDSYSQFQNPCIQFWDKEDF